MGLKTNKSHAIATSKNALTILFTRIEEANFCGNIDNDNNFICLSCKKVKGNAKTFVAHVIFIYFLWLWGVKTATVAKLRGAVL
jgi:hypothetical protein